MDERDAEESTLGALLHSPPSVLRAYITEIGLRPEHFHSPTRGAIYQAIIELVDEGAVPDLQLLAAKKVASVEELDHLAALVPEIANLRIYAQAVKENHRWRMVEQAGNLLICAAENKDPKLETQADELLTAPEKGEIRSYTPEQLGMEVISRFEQGKEETVSFPFPALDNLSGGLRMGEMVFVSGHSSHGKSIFMDMILTKAKLQDYKPHLYINEMLPGQRVDRYLAGQSGVPFWKIRKRELDREELAKVMEAAETIPFGITDIAGWTAEEVARHIRFHDHNVVGVDILHLFDYENERELARIARTLNQVAKTANCVMVITAHLNENRVMAARRPRPTLGDLRGSGDLKNMADLVMFVHREQESDGTLQENGEAEIYIAKGRNTRLGGVEVYLDPKKMVFSETSW